MAFVNDDYVPRVRFYDGIVMGAVNGAMNTRDDSRIFKSGIAIVSGHPLAKRKLKPLQFASNIPHKARRR